MLSGIGPAAHLAEHGIAGPGRPPRRRRQPAGPPRALHPDEEPEAGHPLQPVQLPRHGPYRAAMAAGQGRPRHLEPVRIRRLRPLRPRRRLPRHPVSFPAARRPLRRPLRGQGPRLPGPRRPDALALARHDPPEVRRPDRPAGDPLQLHVDRAGLDRLPPLHPPDPRDLRANPPSAPTPATRSSPGRTCRPTTSSTPSSASTPRARSTPAAPPASAAPTTPAPSSTPSVASSASRPCASPTARSSRASPTATSTPRRSWPARRPPTTSSAAACRRRTSSPGSTRAGANSDR